MGVGLAIALGVAGAAAAGGGAFMSANAASKKRKQLEASFDKWLPEDQRYQREYFADIGNYMGKAGELSSSINRMALGDALETQEMAIPGITEGRKGAAEALFPLLRGELPKSVLDQFRRTGNAGSASRGFMTDPFIDQALSEGQGTLRYMQMGFSLLPQLLGSLPQVPMTSPMSFLSGIMTPASRNQAQLQIRGQNMGVATNMANMQTGGEIWGGALSQVGGAMMGAATMGAMSGGFGGGGTTTPPPGATTGMGNSGPYMKPPTYGWN